MSTEANETKKSEAAAVGAEVAKSAPTEQQASRAGKPKRFAPGQTVCNEKNEKNKLCNGHLKQMQTQHAAQEHLRGDDALHQCQTCGALYMGPPLGHLRDSRRMQRFVERDLTAILQAAGGTLPAYDYPRPYDPLRPGALKPAKATATKTAAAATEEKPPGASAAKPSGATPAPAGETPEQKKARLIAEHKAKLAAKAAQAEKPASAAETDKPATATDQPTTAAPAAAPTDTPPPAPAAGSSADSSAEADRHRPAAEAQAATGQASAAPLSPAAATASPAAGAETVDDLAPEASTELTPGAPKDERGKQEGE